jgi:hypothetical protein
VQRLQRQPYAALRRVRSQYGERLGDPCAGGRQITRESGRRGRARRHTRQPAHDHDQAGRAQFRRLVDGAEVVVER